MDLWSLEASDVIREKRDADSNPDNKEQYTLMQYTQKFQAFVVKFANWRTGWVKPILAMPGFERLWLCHPSLIHLRAPFYDTT